MNSKEFYIIPGKKDGVRIESRILEENIQKAVSQGHRYIEVKAFGQHGIGGRLWIAGDEKVHVKITGQAGQRAGSLGFPNTVVEIDGPCSDDVGWLNAGAEIIVHGNATNGLANAMAQGKVYVAGSIGARGMTMTKQNPRFDSPESWILGAAGDYFGEFMAGGVAVICGVNPAYPDNVLGYRPLVGMVGGKVFFRGPHKGFSQADAKMVSISDDDWAWLTENIAIFLEKIHKPELLPTLTKRDEWQLIIARTPAEKALGSRRSMTDFHNNVWDKELGEGGIIGDLSDMDRSPIGVIENGDLRRFVPVWENRKFKAPCEASCPTGIPVQDRWRLIREGRVDEAVDMALAYTPFPATVCGYLCPNLCMQSCTKQLGAMPSVDITKLGKASIKAGVPDILEQTDKKIAVIGGGPAGISIAWQLRQKGHQAIIFDKSESLGGKILSAIPESRIPKDVVKTEIDRIRKVIPHIHLQQALNKKDIEKLKDDYDFIVIATGAQKPKKPPIPGIESTITSLEFLKKAKSDNIDPGDKVVIIGAGNVACDVATEASRLGAKDIVLIDVQKPAAFGKEKQEAEKVGAKFRWPCFTKQIKNDGVELKTGEIIPADTVVLAIGDMPDLDFLPSNINIKNGYIEVNEIYQTSDPKMFAIGDVVAPGLLTDAIGAGRRAALTISDLLEGKILTKDDRKMIDPKRVTLEYFDPRIKIFDTIDQCGSECASCGACRDCGSCVAICPQTAISRIETANNGFEYIVDENKCIGCGFCAGVCPCGVWNLVANTPLE